MSSFADKVKQYGSVAAALAASGKVKNESTGSWETKKSGSSGSNKSSGSTGSSKSGSSNSTSSGRTLNDKGYDPNVDYSLEIKKAQESGASQATIAQLQKERQAKVDDKYGGSDPYKGSSNIMGSSGGGSSGSAGSPQTSGTPLEKGPGYVTGGYDTGVYGTPILQENPHYQPNKTTGGPDMSRRTDLKNGVSVSNGYTVFYNEDGYAIKAVKGAVDTLPTQNKDYYVENGTYNGGNLWTDEETLSDDDLARVETIRAQMRAGILTGDQANALANEIRSGYGYTIDKAGNVTDLGSQSAIIARRQQLGLSTEPTTAAQQKYMELMGGSMQDMGTTGSVVPEQQMPTAGFDYPTFEEFLEGTGYDQYSEATQAAIRAAVEAAVLGYQQQIDTTNSDTDELARQAYINKMLGEKNLDQQMAASGYAGGMADSMRIANDANYQNELNELEMQRQQVVKELEDAIAQARLSGDLQSAEELANYLSQVQGQWVSYVQNQQAMANQNYWNQQELNAQNQATAREYALSLLASGTMPDASTLASAGISQTEAEAIRRQVMAQTATATPTAASTVQRAAQRTMQTEEPAQSAPTVQKTASVGMNESYFNAFASSLAAQLSTGTEESREAAQANLKAHWDRLNYSQQLKIIELCNRFE